MSARSAERKAEMEGDVGRRGGGGVAGISGCAHLVELVDVRPLSDVCEVCTATALTWNSLLLCRTCGYVGCSDDSQGLHARRRYEWVDHPIVSDLAGRGDRGWCYADALVLELPLLRPCTRPPTTWRWTGAFTER